jgi:hypothetical protein
MMFPSGLHILSRYAMILSSWLHRPCYGSIIMSHMATPMWTCQSRLGATTR